MTGDIDFDDDEVMVEEEEEAGQGRSPLRVILLALVVLVLLCLVCVLATRFVPISLPAIPGLPGAGGVEAPTPPPLIDTPTLTAEEAQVTPAETEEPLPPATEEPGEESPPPTDEGQLPPATEEPLPTEQPSEEEPPATEEPGDSPTATTAPVPGPTATPTTGPTVIITVEPDCEQNSPPVADADGPYEAMMGKGQAIVIFDGSGSSDSDGTIESYEWDFGDGSAAGSGESVTHGYTSTGSFEVTLTVTDNCGATAVDTTGVTISGPTPPANGTVTPTSTPANPPPSESATFGFCHRVQYGQTLSGIAAFYGVPWRVLAEVNGVPMEYFVVANQGLFIPMSELQPGPNVYEVLPGDTLNSVAFDCGLSRQVLADVNNLDVTTPLMPGQQLVIPRWRDVYP
jgi:LysM repeat protein/outer membrane biosynthesis protein TonB